MVVLHILLRFAPDADDNEVALKTLHAYKKQATDEWILDLYFTFTQWNTQDLPLILVLYFLKISVFYTLIK